MKSINLFLAVSLSFTALVSSAQQDSLSIKIGQMIEIGFPTAAVDPKVLEEIRQGKVGAVIIFEKNIPPQNSFNGLKKITWTYQQAATIPLLISIDQEGGRVNRLKEKYGFPKSITAEAMGKSKIDSVKFYSESTAATLAGLGININFAPVVDLAINRDNPIIAKVGRSFSASEDTVIMMAEEVIKAHRKFGVLTALKHFPGHGSSKDDTHKGLTDVTTTWQDRELKPYQALIDSGYVDGVMTSHIVHRTLDPDGHPGTLSDDIMTGILRNRLHFNGVIFSDDMQMHAITKHYSLEDAIKMAINAGVDIMTFSNNIAGSDERTSDKVHSIIRNFVTTGVISAARIDASFKRIMQMKSKLLSKDLAATYNQQILATQKELDAANQQLAAYAEYKEVIEKERKKRERRKKKKK